MAKKVKWISFMVINFLFVLAIYIVKATNIEVSVHRVVPEKNEETYNLTMKQDILCLMMTYPEYITDVNRDTAGGVYLIMKSGSKIIYDDRRVKSSEEKLANPDLQDMMEQVYPLSPVSGLMKKDLDPGRVRVYSLFGEAYGRSNAQIEANLTSVGYGNFQFNRNNKAAESLKNAMKELTVLAKSNRDVSSCLYPINGTFNYRHIAGTSRLSPHAYGIAIDLARDNRDYWKWSSPSQGEQRVKSYPKELVETFEKYNFIWGGKWSHFDILHFEYRPEIILKARYFEKNINVNEKWYKGIPDGYTNIKEYINKINKVIE